MIHVQRCATPAAGPGGNEPAGGRAVRRRPPIAAAGLPWVAAAALLWPGQPAGAVASGPVADRPAAPVAGRSPGAAAADQVVGRLGVLAADGTGGVRVVSVLPQGAAERAGLQAGDLIAAVNGQPARTVAELDRVLHGLPANATATLTVARSGSSRTGSVALGSPAFSAGAAVVGAVPAGAAMPAGGFTVVSPGGSGQLAVAPVMATVGPATTGPAVAAGAGAPAPHDAGAAVVVAAAPVAGTVPFPGVINPVPASASAGASNVPAGSILAAPPAVGAVGDAGAVGPPAEPGTPPASVFVLDPVGETAPAAGTAPVAAPASVLAGAALGAWLSDGDGGVRVEAVWPGGPFEAAGLQAGDVVAAVDGTPLATAAELWAVVGARQTGEPVTLTVRRGEASFDAGVAVGVFAAP